jgi:hypothetical protein
MKDEIKAQLTSGTARSSRRDPQFEMIDFFVSVSRLKMHLECLKGAVSRS